MLWLLRLLTAIVKAFSHHSGSWYGEKHLWRDALAEIARHCESVH